ncbi:hypothetical protein [Steroidobacter agaridevorans]|uniref:hypothetical protein n=1 Tax=Steroidobacter agaridevorans TaxID=2695856 RepID=UPI0013262794|nr:hypothetical protein [Steroidobacter agaridevorans]GFE87857.1 hypothetical protein GCM10011488_28110 [Steroidobacter agaridevorans]
MHFDSETLVALAILLVPTAVLAHRYRVEWGASFGVGSDLWRGPTIVAALLLVGLVAATVYFGADGFREAMNGGRLRRALRFLPFFGLPGIGLAVVLFPGPASELTGRYKALVEDGGTRRYAWLGWGLFALWSFLLFLRWFARTYR